jgi:hypothetical protein
MLARTTLEALCEHEGVSKYKGIKLTSLFHTNLFPNLQKMKIFMPGVKIYGLNLDAMSFAKSAFSPLVRME